jgi:exonuclease III
MTVRIHRPLKVTAFNVNGITRQCYELSKQLQDLHVDVALFSEIHLKPHLGRKGGTAITVRKSITITM